MKLFRYPRLLFFLLGFFSHISAATVSNDSYLLQNYFEKQPNGEYTYLVKEIDRSPDTTTITESFGKRHIAPMISSMIALCTIYQIGKERGFSSFAKLQEDSRSTLVGFSNQSASETLQHFTKYNSRLKAKDIIAFDKLRPCDEVLKNIVTERYKKKG